MKDLRPAIIRAHEKGKGVCEITRFLDIEPSTVSRAIKRFEETDSNEDRYMEMLRAHLIPWTHTIFGDDEWTFQQDGAPGHKAIETQAFLRENCPDFIKVDTHWRNADGEWPPNSPDLNPLDYVVWSILEEKACAKPHKNVKFLKRALKKRGMKSPWTLWSR
uniref:Transposase n=1 Tax=Acrobeloides nanus TaxID=290746 RepID=A0A914ECA4_9BILA